MANVYYVFTINDEYCYVQHSVGMTLGTAKLFRDSCERLSKTGEQFYIFKKQNL